MLDVNDSHQKDIPYFKALSEQMLSGGLQALFYYLLYEVNVNFNTLRLAPVTEALNDQQGHNMTSVQAFWSECLDKEFITKSQKQWIELNPRHEVYDAYLDFCGKSKQTFSRPEVNDIFWKQTYGDKGIFPKHQKLLTASPSPPFHSVRRFSPLPLVEMRSLFQLSSV